MLILVLAVIFLSSFLACSVADCTHCDKDNECASCVEDKFPNSEGSECKSKNKFTYINLQI